MTLDHARVGIDFGTSHTVAVLAVEGRPVQPLVFDGSPMLPSAVCVDSTGHLTVGRDAWHAGLVNAAGFEPYPKRHVDERTLLLGHREIPLVDAIGAVLRRVAEEAGRAAGQPVDHAVLTYPASWATTRQSVLRAAAEQVFARVDLVAEPVAAAQYVAGTTGVPKTDGHVIVYDLGAGTCDASVLRATPAGFELVTAEGLDGAGGLDIDEAIVSHLGAALAGRNPEAWRQLAQPDTVADRRASRLLWEGVRGGKEMLSRSTGTMLFVPVLDEEVPIGRDELDHLARPVLARTVDVTVDAWRSAAGPHPEPPTVYLVGGASRMPLVGTMLHQAFGVPPVMVDQPELAVAAGSVLRPVLAAATGTPPRPAGAVAGASADPPGRRRVLAVLAGAVLLVLVAGVLVTVLSRYHGGRDPAITAGGLSRSASAGPSPSPSPSAPCLTGVWRVDQYQIANNITEDGITYASVFTGGAGATFTFGAKGEFIESYASSQPLDATVAGVAWKQVMTGQITALYAIADGQVALSNTSSTLVSKMYRKGQLNSTHHLDASLEPVRYTCTGDQLRLQTSFSSYQLTRLSN